MQSRGDSQPSEGRRGSQQEPSFLQLLRGNLRVLLYAAGLVVLAYLLWIVLARLFPEIAWLQGPRSA